MLSNQEIKGTLEPLDEEWKNAEPFSREDMEFFNGDRDESPSGWKRMEGVFTAEKIEQLKEPGREYLRRYCDEDEQGRELYTVFWRESNPEEAAKNRIYEEKLKAMDEQWRNAQPAGDDEPLPEDLEEELRELDAECTHY